MAPIAKKYSFEKGQKPWNKDVPNYSMRGINHPNWRGGKTPLVRAIRISSEYRNWRMAVFKKDNFTCVICKKKKEKIQAHHEISFNSIIRDNSLKTLEEAINCKQLWDIENGRTMCVSCHRKTENYGKMAVL